MYGICYRNLYKSQKLLSVTLEGELPFWDVGVMWRGDEVSVPDYMSEEELDSLPAIVLVVLLIAVLCIVYRYLRFRTRPRRKRPARIRRLMSVLRVPTV